MNSTLRLALLAALLPLAGHAMTMVNGVAVPDDVMALARQLVALNSPVDALKRPDNPFAAHPLFQQLVARLDMNAINEQAAQLMVQNLTTDEMRALLAFQSSPTGKSIMVKMPLYQQQVGAMIQNQLKAALDGYLAGAAAQGAQSPGVGAPAPAQAKPVMLWTTPTTPIQQINGTGGSPIGK
jgi:hypothetical protein